MGEREDNVYKAKLAEQAERFEEMVQYMKRVAAINVELSVEERNLLSVAYKNVIGVKRTSWRILSSMEQEQQAEEAEETQPDEKKTDSHKTELLHQYRLQVEKELRDICHDMFDLLDKTLIPAAASGEAKVYYYKMKGDYHRYVAEFAVNSDRKEAAENSLIAYKAASDIAHQELPATHPVRLGLALNFSVFYYEIICSPDRACRLAKAAFDDAVAELDTLPEDGYRDSTLIMQLLRDNLSLWTADMMNEEDGEDDDEDEDDEDSISTREDQIENMEELGGDGEAESV